MDPDSVAEWRQVRIRTELARAHDPWTQSGPAPAPHYEILGELLPTLLYIDAVGVLDSALERFIDREIGRMPKRFRSNLDGRLKLLEDNRRLKDYEAIDKVRGRRNAFAHDGKTSTWTELDDAFKTAELEMLHLAILASTPAYTYLFERGAARDAEYPRYIAATDFTVTVFEGEKQAVKYRIAQLLAKSGQ